MLAYPLPCALSTPSRPQFIVNTKTFFPSTDSAAKILLKCINVQSKYGGIEWTALLEPQVIRKEAASWICRRPCKLGCRPMCGWGIGYLIPSSAAIADHSEPCQRPFENQQRNNASNRSSQPNSIDQVLKRDDLVGCAKIRPKTGLLARTYPDLNESI